MSFDGVQKSRETDGEWQIVSHTCCSNSKCSVANPVESCCRQPILGLLPGTLTTCCFMLRHRKTSKRRTGISCAPGPSANALDGSIHDRITSLLQDLHWQVLKQWSDTYNICCFCCIEHRLQQVEH